MEVARCFKLELRCWELEAVDGCEMAVKEGFLMYEKMVKHFVSLVASGKDAITGLCQLPALFSLSSILVIAVVLSLRRSVELKPLGVVAVLFISHVQVFGARNRPSSQMLTMYSIP